MSDFSKSIIFERYYKAFGFLLVNWCDSTFVKNRVFPYGDKTDRTKFLDEKIKIFILK